MAVHSCQFLSSRRQHQDAIHDRAGFPSAAANRRTSRCVCTADLTDVIKEGSVPRKQYHDPPHGPGVCPRVTVEAGGKPCEPVDIQTEFLRADTVSKKVESHVAHRPGEPRRSRSGELLLRTIDDTRGDQPPRDEAERLLRPQFPPSALEQAATWPNPPRCRGEMGRALQVHEPWTVCQRATGGTPATWM